MFEKISLAQMKNVFWGFWCSYSSHRFFKIRTFLVGNREEEMFIRCICSLIVPLKYSILNRALRVKQFFLLFSIPKKVWRRRSKIKSRFNTFLLMCSFIEYCTKMMLLFGVLKRWRWNAVILQKIKNSVLVLNFMISRDLREKLQNHRL